MRDEKVFELLEFVLKELLPAMLDAAQKQKGSRLTRYEISVVIHVLKFKLNEDDEQKEKKKGKKG